MAAKRTSRTPKRGKPPKDWRVVVLTALSRSGNVRWSAERAKVGRTKVYEHRNADPVFAKAWDEATDNAIDTLEQEAWRRARDGTLKPIYQGGDKVGAVREFSDVLLIFLMKANRPEKYRDNYDANKKLVELLSQDQRFVIPVTDDRPEPDAQG